MFDTIRCSGRQKGVRRKKKVQTPLSPKALQDPFGDKTGIPESRLNG